MFQTKLFKEPCSSNRRILGITYFAHFLSFKRCATQFHLINSSFAIFAMVLISSAKRWLFGRIDVGHEPAIFFVVPAKIDTSCALSFVELQVISSDPYQTTGGSQRHFLNSFSNLDDRLSSFASHYPQVSEFHPYYHWNFFHLDEVSF